MLFQQILQSTLGDFMLIIIPGGIQAKLLWVEVFSACHPVEPGIHCIIIERLSSCLLSRLTARRLHYQV